MRCIFLVLLISWSSYVVAQTTLNGIVLDAATQSPLEGAHITGKNTREGTYSDAKGNFVLFTTADSVEITHISYQPVVLGNLENGGFYRIEMQGAVVSSGPVITVRASPIEATLPAPILKITATALQRDNEVSITPALNRVPGVFMHSGSLNTNRITLRGIGNRSPFATTKIRAYLDEIPLTSGVGETTLEDIDLSLIREVRVWKGPTASIYGAGLGGMIHLKSKNAADLPEGTSLEGSSAWGSYGLWRKVGQLMHVGPEKKTQLLLNYNDLQSEGYRENNAYNRKSFTTMARLISDERNTTTLLAGFTDLKAFIPSSINGNDFLNDPRKAAANWAAVRGFEDYEKVLAGISHRHEFSGAGKKIRLINTSSLFTTFRSNYESRPFNILRENSRAIGARTNFELKNREKGKWPDLHWGGEYFLEWYGWQTNQTIGGILDTLLSDNEETRRYFNLFAEAHWIFSEKWFALVGANINQTHYDYTDRFVRDGDRSGDYRFDLIVSPRFGIGYFFLPKVSFFASVSHGFSAPTLEETLTPEGTINPEIRPEKGWNFEIGSRGKYLGGKLSFDIALYKMLVRDLLVARRLADDQFVGINAGMTVHNGLEVFAQYEFRPFLSFFLSYSYSDYRFDDFVDREKDFSGNDLTGTAPHLFHAGIDAGKAIGWYGHLNYQLVDAMPVTDDNTVYSDAYHLANLRIGYRHSMGARWLFDIHAGIGNLWSERYASMLQINAPGFGNNLPRYYYPGLPRNFFGGLKFRYSFVPNEP